MWGCGGRETYERGDICILMAHSCCCVAETSTTVILQLKINLKKQIFIEGLLQDEHCSNYWGYTVVEKKKKKRQVCAFVELTW